jgi:dienelactone hydrolase
VVAIVKALSAASASALLIACGIGETAKAENYNPTPIYHEVESYTTTISKNNNLADIYFPKSSNANSDKQSFPIALLLQGANVDKSSYSDFARIVASYGFVVVVPNNQKIFPQGGTMLFSDTSQIEAVLETMKGEDKNPLSPVAGIVNTKKLGLLGHSAGGAVGLSAIANICIPALCTGSFQRPIELKAGAFFGANLPFTPINNSEVPVALLQGSLDSIASFEKAQNTYEQIQNPPKTLISILGTNHYGITNTNNPQFAIPDPNISTLPQNTSVETIARWSGLFLRASLLKDKDAFKFIYFTGDAVDENVTVTSQKRRTKSY